ncbi:hemicentin-1-like [Acipenser ruthenus]|uniref:hemicentin-1-like n=1 Tax=Acipenser ruthenus TaxID=7906 RepID=UPI002741A243|nr:hemicentin-1-like [Acipenser ruthenus]XP_058861520.1 hemicentin-1-like [Acipenser ruthenus]
MALYFLSWSVILHYYLWDSSCSAELVFTSRPNDSIASLDKPLMLSCAAYDAVLQSQAAVEWFRNLGEPILDLNTRVYQPTNGSLFFPSLRAEDLGSYTCQASSRLSVINTTFSIYKAYMAPVFYSPVSQTVNAGESAFFECVSGDSRPSAQIRWEKEGKPLAKGIQFQGQYGGGNHMKVSGTLHIPVVSQEDEGEYVCVTHNPLLGTDVYSEAAILTVRVLPSKLVIAQSPADLTIATGKEAVLKCIVHGFPRPSVQWFRNNRPLENTTHLALEEGGQLLVFKNVSLEDEGHYYCEARNAEEAVTSPAAYLLPAVMDWSFEQQPANVTAVEGEAVTLTCRPPSSRPPATVTWFMNSRILKNKPHFTVLESGDLFFKRIQEVDRGIYFCRAANPYLGRSVSSGKLYLNVLVPPEVTVSPQLNTVLLGSGASFQCHTLGQPSPSIHWYRRGQAVVAGGRITLGFKNKTLYISSVLAYDEGAYTCEAKNLAGQSRETAVLQVTVPPVIVSFTNEMVSSEGSSVVLPCGAVGDSPITYSWFWNGNSIQIAEPQLHKDDEGALHISNISRHDEGSYVCTAENAAGRDERAGTMTVSGHDRGFDEAEKAEEIGSGNLQRSYISEWKNLFSSRAPVNENPSDASLKKNIIQEQSNESPARSENKGETPVPHHKIATEVSYYTTTTLTVHPPSSAGLEDTTTPSETPTGSAGAQDFAVTIPSLSLKDPDFTASFSPGSLLPIPLKSTQLPAPAPTAIQNAAPMADFNTPEVKSSSQLELETPQTITALQPLSEAQTHPPDACSHLTTVGSLHSLPAEHLQNRSGNSSKPGNSELTEWPKKNTSQSPMRTSNDMAQDKNSWFPVLEKHDIPIVVGVGVSLALIFIMMGFYSLVQKNETAPPAGRGWLRNSDASSRNSSKPEMARTYENRAFEDDTVVAVIEQSPYKSTSRSSQFDPNTITVTAELTPNTQQEGLEPILENNGETLLETGLEQESELPAHNEKNSTLPNPGISLKCLDAWTGNTEGNEEAEPSVTAVGLSSANPTQHQEAEAMAHPNPASLEEGVHTSFTFQTSEPSGSNTTPIRHNINISRSLLAPLVLSHSVSVNERNSSGLTTVAVDVHFYSGTPAPSTLPGLVLNSGTIYCPPSSNGQTPFPEYDQQTSSVHYVQRTCL